MVSPIRLRSTGQAWLTWFLFGAFIVPATSSPLAAADFSTASGLNIRWDNTLLYSAEIRTEPVNSTLVSNPNADDGDRNFVPGLVSNRLDWRSVFSLSRNE
jgi:hypothetical protein